MGFCDYVKVEKGEFGLADGSIFQSKSLHQTGGEFTITRDGTLVQHLFRYEDDPQQVNPFTGFPLPKHVSIGERVIDYHGDILLYYHGADEPSLELVARFTHGRLEWLRPQAEYPNANYLLLLEQGAR